MYCSLFLTVSNMKLYKGQLVSPGQSLFGFIDNKKWWIDANFKETDLNRIKPGQEVKAKASADIFDAVQKKINSIPNLSNISAKLESLIEFFYKDKIRIITNDQESINEIFLIIICLKIGEENSGGLTFDLGNIGKTEPVNEHWRP